MPIERVGQSSTSGFSGIKRGASENSDNDRRVRIKRDPDDDDGDRISLGNYPLKKEEEKKVKAEPGESSVGNLPVARPEAPDQLSQIPLNQLTDNQLIERVKATARDPEVLEAAFSDLPGGQFRGVPKIALLREEVKRRFGLTGAPSMERFAREAVQPRDGVNRKAIARAKQRMASAFGLLR